VATAGDAAVAAGGAVAATREEWKVTAEVVSGLFWSGFGSTKYMDKTRRRMYGRWKMMNFFII